MRDRNDERESHPLSVPPLKGGKKYMGWIPVCTGMTKVPDMRKNDPTFLVKLYNFGFSVVIVAKGNHDDEKGDHVHGGDHRFDRTEKLG